MMYVSVLVMDNSGASVLVIVVADDGSPCYEKFLQLILFKAVEDSCFLYNPPC